jgi:tetratricopeptide (TPR) repeat protein
MLHKTESPAQKIVPMPAPDCHYLNAAQGWIELNDSAAAEKELQKINPDARQHPLFLLVRWELYANGKQWQAAHTIAEYLVENFPEEPIGWLQRSYALHALGRTVEAFQQLLPAAPKFTKIATVTYHLACYACTLGYIEEAWHWLDKAIAAGDGDTIKSMALEDPILRPLWQHLEG